MGRIGDWVEVATARDLIHAYLLRSVLDNAGIEVRIGNEYLQGALGDLPLDFHTRPKILVHGRSLEYARSVLDERAEPGSDDEELDAD
ncbi:hypothetical protein Pla163_35180 [Planctomycetes bacterium Pla163]|uniref:DUF2007 domain-containing protein n=1 Tax=Rohdeia mirabilis TaxID=2528008 RepID=A0A518D4G1_9BACT|nr:hypothetical protein Pla163_35180 [Planctomycetes bacterium Pla163]